jgi:hypothetical protein
MRSYMLLLVDICMCVADLDETIFHVHTRTTILLLLLAARG